MKRAELFAGHVGEPVATTDVLVGRARVYASAERVTLVAIDASGRERGTGMGMTPSQARSLGQALLLGAHRANALSGGGE